MFRRSHACLGIVTIAVSFSVGFVILAQSSRPAGADDAEQQQRKERYTNWMRTYAEGTKVVLPKSDGNEERVALLDKNPVFRYSDEEHLIPDATLWVWTHVGRPVGFQKVEGNDHGGDRKWTICFASLSEGLIDVRWPKGREFAARKPGVRFESIPRAESPADNARGRTVQLRALTERFTARLNVDAEGKGGAETRSMPKPIFEYSDPESKLPLGAIFGMTSTGTNPNLLLVIEARRDKDGKLRWEYAHARMTSTSVRFRLDGEEIWAEQEVADAAFENWIYYFLRRDFK